MGNRNKGFTLIELLVVIAVIGILATIVLVVLGNVRQRAKDTAVLSSLSSVVPVAQLCIDGNQNLNAPAPDNKVCELGGIDKYPELPANSGWAYVARYSSLLARTFSFCAANNSNAGNC